MKTSEFYIKNDIKQIAFERYKLWWMICHGFTLGDFTDALEHQMEAENDIEPITDPLDISFRGLMEKWEHDICFGGSVWPCFEEFCTHEYRDAKIMYMLLSMTERKRYEKDILSSVAYEVQTFADNDEILTVNTFDTLSKAKQMYDRLRGSKALLKVDLDGEPIEELEYEKE